MKNIIKIFCADFRRLSTNVVAVVVIMGLSVIPSLYAWFNILSNWDPYAQEATSNLKIAVVSQDEGTEVAGISMNIDRLGIPGYVGRSDGRCVQWGILRGTGDFQGFFQGYGQLHERRCHTSEDYLL